MCWEDSKKIRTHLRNSIQILPANGGPAKTVHAYNFPPRGRDFSFLIKTYWADFISVSLQTSFV